MDYETIKQTAKEMGCTIEELCALTPSHDPFYTGTPSEMAMAHWFAELWERFGYTTGVHLRRVHYQIVSQDEQIRQHNGKPYENTFNCWQHLCRAGKYARYLGLVNPFAFIDQRNPEAVINTEWKNPGDWGYEDPTPDFNVMMGEELNCELPELPELSLLPEFWETGGTPQFHIAGYVGRDWPYKPLVQQGYHVEVWCEKTTMNDVLEPLCRKYNVNFITGAGRMSITATVDFLARAKKAQRPARILYISDHDPAGVNMPIEVARKIEFYQRKKGYGNLDIKLQPIALIGEQIAAYDLPEAPVKATQAKRWDEHQEGGVTELDALEALYPGELHSITEKAILQYYDPELEAKVKRAKEEFERDLDDFRDSITDQYQEELADIEADYDELRKEIDDLQESFAELVAPFQEELGAYQECLDDIRKRWKDTIEAIADDLKTEAEQKIDLDDYPLPEPNLPPEADDLLYTSERDYMQQLEFYQVYRGK